MCGIIAILSDEIVNSRTLQDLKLLIDKRGPDYNGLVKEIKTHCDLKLHVKASVLHLRGDVMQKQPILDSDNNCLLFNGQTYNFDNVPIENSVSDTTYLFDRLKLCCSREEVAQTLAFIDGPFAFVHWNASLKTLFYGRDIFGRKSLCMLTRDGLPLLLSSVSISNRGDSFISDCIWSEVDCSGIHCIDFSSNEPKVMVFSWQLDRIYPITTKCVTKCPKVLSIPLNDSMLLPLNWDDRQWSDFASHDHMDAINKFSDILVNAVAKRIIYNRKDCLTCRDASDNPTTECNHSQVLVAFSGGIDSTILALALHKVLNENQTIDLSTVAFKEDSPDRESVGLAFKELRRLCPGRNWRLILADIEKDELKSHRDNVIRHLILPCNTVIDDSLGCGCWFIGRARGRAIDSSIPEYIFEQIFEAFLRFQPARRDSSMTIASNCDLIDLNYCSPASMIFAGMSIDEQLGGYSSHKAAWSRGGSKAVIEEISFQMRRLSSRNLGRDDRCFSHHGRDVKLPYLDRDLVSFLNQLPLGLKMSLNELQGVGPKKILRELAESWGLRETSKRVKRALQFGTRIANLEDSNEKGNNICERLRDDVWV